MIYRDVCELFSCSLISNRTILWIILARILSTAFVHIHENEWTSSLMIFLKSCVYIKGMFNPEINQLMFIIHTCSILLLFFFIFGNFKKIWFDIVFCLSQTRVSFNWLSKMLPSIVDDLQSGEEIYLWNRRKKDNKNVFGLSDYPY